MSTNLVKILQDNKAIESEMTQDDSEKPQAAKILLDPSACQAALDLVEADQIWHKTLRLYLEGKGCDGFTYGVAFDPAGKSDHVFPQDLGLQVTVDTQTFPYVQGATITWVDDERGRGFLVDNPRHRKFRGKFYRRKNWEQKLLEVGL